MKAEDATKVKEKLNDILLAVDQYGKQSEQFSNARQSLFDLLGVMNNTNSSLGQLLTSCDQYLRKASEVIDGEYFVKIQGVINEINTTATNLEKCNANTSLESVRLIEESKRQLTELADTLSDNIEKSVDKVRGTADDLQTYSKHASDNAKALIQSSSNEILDLVEKLTTICDSLLKESAQLKKNDAEIIESQNRIFANIDKLHNFLAEGMQRNNEVCNDILKELNAFEEKSLNNKAEIISTIKDAVEKGVADIKNYETINFSSIKEMFDKRAIEINKKIKNAFVIGGSVAAVIIGLLIINIVI